MNYQRTIALAIAEQDAKAGQVGFAHSQLKIQYPELGFIFDQLEDAMADRDEIERDLQQEWSDENDSLQIEIENLKDVLQQIRNVADAAMTRDDGELYESSKLTGATQKFAVALDIIAGKADEAIT